MGGSRIALVALSLAVGPGVAEAQSREFTGLLTGHIGVAAGRDVRDPTVSPGFSMAVIDENGIGIELDVAYTGDFDAALFADSSITSAMLSFSAVYPHERWRPFLVGGAGLMRVRTAIFDGLPPRGRTEPGWTAGGGVLLMLDETLGVRGDVRFFRHFGDHPDLPVQGFLDFWRISGGVTFVWPMR